MYDLIVYKSILKCKSIATTFVNSQRLSALLDFEYQAVHDLPVSLLYRIYDYQIDSIHACALSIYRNIHVYI